MNAIEAFAKDSEQIEKFKQFWDGPTGQIVNQILEQAIIRHADFVIPNLPPVAGLQNEYAAARHERREGARIILQLLNGLANSNKKPAATQPTEEEWAYLAKRKAEKQNDDSSTSGTDSNGK